MKKPRSFKDTRNLNCLVYPGMSQVFQEQRPVVIHCRWKAEDKGFFRLSCIISLVDYKTHHHSHLLYAEGLDSNLFMVKDQEVKFTLYFEPLPEKCVEFSIRENVRNRWPYGAYNIKRIKPDVYRIDLEILPF